jgi:hypothetical protein
LPTILRIRGYRFHFYSDESSEPHHIHVERGEGECKYWLNPVIKLARNKGLKPAELKTVEKLVYEYKDFLIKKYNEFHQHKKK